MKKLVFKNTYPNMALAVIIGILSFFAIVHLASLTGCSKAIEPTRISEPQLLTFQMKSVAPISPDTAYFTLVDQFGSEITVPVWRDGDSLACPYSTLSWSKWLKCINTWTTYCGDTFGRSDQSEDFWRCIAQIAAGCTVGTLWVDFAANVLTPWTRW